MSEPNGVKEDRIGSIDNIAESPQVVPSEHSKSPSEHGKSPLEHGALPSEPSADEKDSALELDLHELSLLYPLRTTLSAQEEDSATATTTPISFSNVSVHLAGRESDGITVASIQLPAAVERLAATDFFPCLHLYIPAKYPQESCRIQVSMELEKVLREKLPNADTAFPWAQDSTEDAEGRRWLSVPESGVGMLDLVNTFNLAFELFLQEHLRADLKQPPVLVRDFAYPIHTGAHFGRHASAAVRKVRAIFEFQAQDENELYLTVGDVVDVLYERPDGWIVGMLNGISGLVPKNHVEPVTSGDASECIVSGVNQSSVADSRDPLMDKSRENILAQPQFQ